MCLACREYAIWRAYLESRDPLKPDDATAAEALFSAFPVPPPPAPVQPDEREEAKRAPTKSLGKDNKNPFSCDDPTAG